MSFLKVQASFPSNFASMFNTIKHNCSVLFKARKFYTLVKSSSLKCKFLRFLNALVKICQIHVIFQITSQFFFKFYDSSVSRKVTPLYFFGSKVIYFARKGPMKVQILETFKCSDQNSPNSCHF